MNALIGFTAALLAAIAPAAFPDAFEHAVQYALPDSRIALVASFFADPQHAQRTVQLKALKATAHWKRARSKKVRPFLPKESVTLEAWLFDEDSEHFRWPVQVFNENVPNVTITMRSFSEERNYISALKTAIAKGESPDIVMVKNGWMPDLKPLFTPAPEPLFISRECFDFFFPFACDAFTEKERVYAIPIFVRSLFLIVNKSLLEDDRIVVGDRPSESWRGFMENEQKFRKFQDPTKLFFTSLDLPSQSKTPIRLFSALMAQSGQERPNEDSVKDAIRFLELLYSYSERKDEGYNINKKTSVERFLNGDTAVIFGTEEEYLEITQHFVVERNPLVKVSDISTVPLPYIDPAYKTTAGESWGLAVPSSTSHPDAAWAFLTFMAEEENIKSHFVRSKRTPGRRALSDYNTFRDSANSALTPPTPFATLDFELLLAENIEALLERDPNKQKTREQVIEAIEQFRKNYESRARAPEQSTPPPANTSIPEPTTEPVGSNTPNPATEPLPAPPAIPGTPL